MAKTTIPIDTNELILGHRFYEDLLEDVTYEGDCVIYPRQHVTVGRRRQARPQRVSILRAVYAYVNVARLTEDEIVALTCENRTHKSGDTPTCINPAHIVRSTRADIQRTRKDLVGR